MRAILLTAAALLVAAGPLGAERWEVVPVEDEVLVKFLSKAPLDSFEGKTGKVSGTIELDPTDVSSIALEITVDMASLDTGIGLRNTHMRENHLHTDEHPTAVFTGGTIVEGGGADLGDAAEHALVVEGEMTLHGVTRTVGVPLGLRLEGGTLHVASEFPVALSDYDIPRPKFLVMQLGDVQKVTVALTATRVAE